MAGRGASNPVARRSCAALLTLAAILLPSYGAAQADRDDRAARVQSWVQREWRSAKDLPPFPGVSLRWRTEDRFVPLPADLAQLESEVANKPDHPARAKLAIYYRRKEHGPDVRHLELWWRAGDAWRINTTEGDGRSYSDTTLTPTQAWSLTPRILTLASPNLGPAGLERFLNNRSTFLPEVALLLQGGFGLAGIMRLGDPSPVVLAGDSWGFSAENGADLPADHRLRVRFSGRWDDRLSRGFTENITVEQSPTNNHSTWDLSQWTLDDRLGAYVAGQVHFVSTEFDRLTFFEGAEPEPPGGFDALTRAPEPGGRDAIRGPVDTPAVQDLRSGVTTVRADDGSVQVTRGAPAISAGAPAAGRARWLGIAALVAASAAIMALACAKWRRSQRALRSGIG